MYLDGPDYRTIWQLAHLWADIEEAPDAPLNPAVKLQIHRILVAIRNNLIKVRNKRLGVIFESESTFDFIFFYISHHLRFNACLRKDKFDKNYLNSLYVWKPEVIQWCNQHQHTIPTIWLEQAEEAEEDSENQEWLARLTPRKKQIVGALHIAQRIWEEDPNLDYADVYEHPDMLTYDKPRRFPSLDSFKAWTRSIAPDKAKSRGRRVR